MDFLKPLKTILLSVSSNNQKASLANGLGEDYKNYYYEKGDSYQ